MYVMNRFNFLREGSSVREMPPQITFIKYQEVIVTFKNMCKVNYFIMNTELQNNIRERGVVIFNNEIISRGR